MFYAHFVLAKKGPLARIWLAAHWDKKLTKAHVFETNIEKSVEGILQPKVKMALRTSGHLLLGVVRIYSRKAKYLLADCNEAFVKIKMAFRPGMVDLPEDIREAAVSAITFPEVFHDFDTPMPELNDVDIQAQFSLNQSRAEEITMREDYGNISLVTGDDGFGDMGFEEPPELMRGGPSIDHNLDQTNLIFADDLDKEKDEITLVKDQTTRLSVARSTSVLDLEVPMRDDGFGGNLGQDIISGGLFEGGLFDDTPVVLEEKLSDNPLPKAPKIQDDSDDDGGDLDRFGGPPSVDPPSSDGGSPCPSPRPEALADAVAEQIDEPVAAEESASAPPDQTTLLHNEEESFALAPVDSSAIKSGWPRIKRKRKLIVDEVKNISGEEMKSQLSDTTDIVTTLDLAPPSKRLMHWKETGGVEKLFALPGRSIPASIMSEMYLRNLTSEYCVNEDFGMAGDKELENLRLEQVKDDEMAAAEPLLPRPRGRPPKRKLPEEEEKERAKPSPAQQARDFNALLSPEQLVEQLAVADQPDEANPPEEAVSAADESLVPPSVGPLDETETETNANENENPPEFVSDGAADMRSPDIASPPPAVPEKEKETVQPEVIPPPEPLVEEPSIADLASPPPVDVMDHDGHHTIEVPENDDAPEPFSPPPAAVVPEEGIEGSQVKHEIEDEYEEQAEDETYEEYEERVVNKRAAAMFLSMKKTLRTGDIYFNSLILGNNRKQVAQKFYTCLTLKKLNAIELEQDGAYAPITIKRGIQFDKAKL